jgi:hypothetical protein
MSTKSVDKLSFGGLLILIGILLVLLDRFPVRSSVGVNREGEIKLGHFSIKGGVGVLVLVLGVLVYLLEEGLLKF